MAVDCARAREYREVTHWLALTCTCLHVYVTAFVRTSRHTHASIHSAVRNIDRSSSERKKEVRGVRVIDKTRTFVRL